MEFSLWGKIHKTWPNIGILLCDFKRLYELSMKEQLLNHNEPIETSGLGKHITSVVGGVQQLCVWKPVWVN